MGPGLRRFAGMVAQFSTRFNRRGRDYGAWQLRAWDSSSNPMGSMSGLPSNRHGSGWNILVDGLTTLASTGTRPTRGCRAACDRSHRGAAR
jgi:hypothetical protein